MLTGLRLIVPSVCGALLARVDARHAAKGRAREALPDEVPRPEQPDDGLFAQALESEADESGGEREPPSDDDYVPV